MKKLQRVLSQYKWEILFFSFVLVVYVFTRLYNLMQLPIFTDEAIYARWAQIAKNDASWRFISLTDGKQPLFVWIAMVLMKFFADPLLASRLVSVGAGFATTIGMFFLGYELFRNRWIGLISSALYVIYPFALVYDRMALYDSLVGMFAIWSLYIAVLFVRHIRLDIALILGMVIGAGALTKSNAFFNAIMLPSTLLLLFPFAKGDTKKIMRWVALVFLVVLEAVVIYSILRLSPFFHIIGEKNYEFIYPLSEWMKHPFEFFFGNLVYGEFRWLHIYMTWLWLGLGVASFLLSKTYWREKILLVLWFIVPFIALAFFGKVLYPRFIFFMTLYLLPLVAYSLVVISQKMQKLHMMGIIAFVILMNAMVLYSDYFIMTDFANAPLPKQDRNQYIADWPAGGGIAETVVFLKNEAKDKKIYVATQGTFGLLPYALELYLINDPNITIVGYWPIEGEIPKELVMKASVMPTYAVFYQTCPSCVDTGIAPKTWPLKVITQHTKPSRKSFLTLYEVVPPKQ